jgi:hypothetical protein
MMSKTYWVFIVVLAALAIWGTEKAIGQTTTILAPDGSVTVCQVGSNGIVICYRHAMLHKIQSLCLACDYR